MERKIVKHATVLSAAHDAAADADFRIGQHVRTLDGFLGRVLLVSESFAPGNVEYQIVLDSGAGGGTYLASQLRPVPEAFGGGHQAPAYLPAGVHTAELETVASEDYPEMGDVLHERPDPGRQITVIGALRTGHYFQDTWSTDHNQSYHPGPMPRLYHGTNHPFGIGHHVEPGHQTHYEGAYDGMEDEASTRVHATPSVEQAWQHADNAVHEHGGSHHVFEVEPTGKVTWGDEAFPEDFEHDDEMNAHATRMSQSPFKVTRELPYRGEPLPFTQRHQAASYADGFDPREDEYNGVPQVGGVYWGAPAQQAFVDQELGQPEDPGEMMGLEPPPQPPPEGLESTATTINKQKIDDHGDAPEHGTIPRASDPNPYDDRSTEGEGDGKWDDPLPKAKTGLSPEEVKKRENGATIGMYPEGISAGGGPGIGVGAIVASSREDKSDRWHEYNQAYRPDTIHRGIHVQLPDDLHSYVHDDSQPRDQRAHALAAHFQARGGLGMHWTPHTQIANRAIGNAADQSYPPYFEHQEDSEHYWSSRNDPETDVMFHASTGRRNRLRNPEELDRHQIGWAHSKDEDEFPVKPGSPMRLEGISWKPHDSEHPNEPFEHHDFATPLRHTAGLVTARVPWTPQERTHLHSWQEAPTATEGDFVPSGSFTNKRPQYVPEPDEETEFAEAVGPRAFTEMTARLAGHSAVEPAEEVEPAEDDLEEGDEEIPPDDDVTSGHQTHSSEADEVFAQLAEDFPPEVLDWVFDVEWDGPLAVPLDQVDFADEAEWEASSQPEKVEKFREKIEKKESKGKHPKPAILVARPSYPALFVADGHHRALAERELEEQGEGDRAEPGLWAFVATAPEDDGPWMTMHDEQEPGGGDGLETGEEMPGEPGMEDDLAAGPEMGGSFEPGADQGDDYSDMGFEPQLGLPPMSQGGTPSRERAQKAMAVDPMGEPAPPDEPIEDEEEDPDDLGLPFDDEEDDEGEDDKPPPKKKEKKAALAAFVQAAGDPAFRFEFTAAWRDVVAKAKRINGENGVRITAAYGTIVIGEVKGDHATYESGLQYYPGRPYSVMAYSCGCPWATFHQDADYPGRFNGRLCSHAYALGLAAREHGMAKRLMFPETAGWPEQVVTKSEPPWHPSDKSWARQWEAPMTRQPVMGSLDSLIPDTVSAQVDVGRVPAVTAARVLIRAGEDRAVVTSLLSCAGLSFTADQANAPWGSQNVAETPPAKPYGATSPPEKDRDPGSYGPLSGPDPDNWGEIQDNSAIQMPLTSDAALHDPDEVPEYQESHAYTDQAGGPSTSMTPRDPQGIRMEEARRVALAAFTASMKRSAELKDEPEPALDPDGLTADSEENPQNPWGNSHQGTYEDAKAYNLARTIPDYSNTSSTTDTGRAQHPAQETQNPGLGSQDDPYSPSDPSIQTQGNQQWSGNEIDSGDLAFRPDVQEHIQEQESDHDPVAQFHMTGAAQQYRTDGAVQVGDSDIAAAARAFLKTADVLPPEEADELIREGRGTRARNLDMLDLKGTHYVDDDRLDDHEDDVIYA